MTLGERTRPYIVVRTTRIDGNLFIEIGLPTIIIDEGADHGRLGIGLQTIIIDEEADHARGIATSLEGETIHIEDRIELYFELPSRILYAN
jgi:hypothetical protein